VFGASLLLSSVSFAVTHEVKTGDSLSVLAEHYGVSTDALMKANGIKNPNTIRIGQKLQIPTTGKAKEAKAEPDEPKPPPAKQEEAAPKKEEKPEEPKAEPVKEAPPKAEPKPIKP
jgi:murein DD-endopeptidase MepM/ murein hydrolase activator NlpD